MRREKKSRMFASSTSSKYLAKRTFTYRLEPLGPHFLNHVVAHGVNRERPSVEYFVELVEKPTSASWDVNPSSCHDSVL